MTDQVAKLHSADVPLISVKSVVRDVFHQPIFKTYLVILLCWGVADATISTLTPIIIEETVSNPILLGLIYSFSSLVGIFCDFLFSKVFHVKSSRFFIKWFVAFTILLPIWYIVVPHSIPTLLIGMAIWGIYYELEVFSNFSVIRERMTVKQHSAAWGLIQTAVSLAYTIATPVMAYVASIHLNAALFSSAVITALAAIIFRKSKLHKQVEEHSSQLDHHVSFAATIAVWMELMKKVWPLFVFFTVLYLSNVSFWTIGILFAAELQQTSFAGYALLATFTLPYLLVTIVPPYFASKYSKKRVALICGAIAGIFLFFAGLSVHPWIIVGMMLVASSAVAIAIPLVQAVFEDYVSRLDTFHLQMVGIQASAVSLAYIIGPTLNGIIASQVGYQRTFSAIGFLITAVSLIFILIIRGKIRMPMRMLRTVELNSP